MVSPLGYHRQLMAESALVRRSGVRYGAQPLCYNVTDEMVQAYRERYGVE